IAGDHLDARRPCRRAVSMGKCAHLLTGADERTNQFSAHIPGGSADEEHRYAPSVPSPGTRSPEPSRPAAATFLPGAAAGGVKNRVAQVTGIARAHRMTATTRGAVNGIT